MPAETSYISIVETGASASGKTKNWVILNKASQEPLGYIQWYPGWRKYTILTTGKVILDEKCLREIADFVESQTRIHKDAIRQR